MGQAASKPSDTLTVEEIRELSATFQSFDVDGTGSIDSEELEQLMQALGQTPTKDELAQMLEDMDEDGNGTIELDEFLTTMSKRSDGFKKEVKLAFHVFDKNGDGFIEREEVEDVFRTIGEKLTRRELHKLLRLADADPSGRITFRGFSDMMTRVDLRKDSAGTTLSSLPR